MANPFKSRWSGIGVGGSPALDFVNTLDWRLRKEPLEGLHAYSDLLRWSWSAGILTGAQARSLLAWAASHPKPAARELARAIELREAIACLFASVRNEERLPPASLELLDAFCRAGSADRSLRPAGRFAAWGWSHGDPPPRRPAWAVALDATRILTSSERERLCQCDDLQCGWFFLDTSRNRSRRWCTMKGCGNRNKARSFYRRSQSGRQKGSRTGCR